MACSARTPDRANSTAQPTASSAGASAHSGSIDAATSGAMTSSSATAASSSRPRTRRLGRTRRRPAPTGRGDAPGRPARGRTGGRRRAGGRSSDRGNGIRVVVDALGDADGPGLGGDGPLDEHLRAGGAGGVHGVRARCRLGEVGAGQGVSSLQHAHRLTELLDRARSGHVVAPADPVLHEIGSPDTEEDQEDQARRRLHVTTVGARRRQAPDPHRCVAQVTVVTTVPGEPREAGRSPPRRSARGGPTSVSPARSSVVSANDRWSRQAPAMCR